MYGIRGFVLNATLQHHSLKNLSIVEITFYIEILMRVPFVNGATNSFDNVHKCSRFFNISKTCLAAVYFNLQKWATNHSYLCNISENENLCKVLELKWDLHHDFLILNSANITKGKTITNN